MEATPQTPPPVQPELDARAREVLTMLFQEENLWARHHEAHRASATTVTLSVATAILGVIGALYAIGDVDKTIVVFLAAALLALSVTGSMLAQKHFERAMHNLRRGDAYRDLLVARFSDTELRLLFPRKEDLPMMKLLQGAVNDVNAELPLRGQPGKTGLVNAREKLKGEIGAMNPMRVDLYVTPLANQAHRWSMARFRMAQPFFDLYKLWGRLYIFLGYLAVAIALHALWGGRVMTLGLTAIALVASVWVIVDVSLARLRARREKRAQDQAERPRDSGSGADPRPDQTEGTPP